MGVLATPKHSWWGAPDGCTSNTKTQLLGRNYELKHRNPKAKRDDEESVGSVKMMKKVVMWRQRFRASHSDWCAFLNQQLKADLAHALFVRSCTPLRVPPTAPHMKGETKENKQKQELG